MEISPKKAGLAEGLEAFEFKYLQQTKAQNKNRSEEIKSNLKESTSKRIYVCDTKRDLLY